MLANTQNQCAAVNFATGSNETLGDSCKNSTASFKAEWANSTESEDSGHSGHMRSALETKMPDGGRHHDAGQVHTLSGFRRCGGNA